MTGDTILSIKEIFRENSFFDNQLIEHYAKNVSSLKRKISGVVYPTSTAEIRQLVLLANQTGLELHPVSTGKNWGLGSKLPVKDGAVVVELSRMNKIHEINEHFGYAVIEPGVTQEQLYQALKEKNLHTKYNINPTGSGKDTSIIGNCLDRGVGYLSTRATDILNLEVVLGIGDIIQTGYGHFKQATAKHLYRYGIGPSLDGIFMQSNFGIVSKATFELRPISDYHGAIMCGLEDESQLAEFIDQLYSLRKKGIIRTAFHIGNKARLEGTLIPMVVEKFREAKNISRREAHEKVKSFISKNMKKQWTAIGGFGGEKKIFREIFSIVKNKMSVFGKVTLMTDKKMQRAKMISQKLSFIDRFYIRLCLLESLGMLYDLTKGIPTNESLKSLWIGQGAVPDVYTDPDHSSIGLLFTTPVIPMEGKSVLTAKNLTKHFFLKHGFQDYFTLNMCTDKTLECVINVLFDRTNQEESERAHRCIRELNAAFIKRGLIPYRSSIHLMEQIVGEEDLFWQTTKKLKSALDPNHIISPLRYNLV